MWSSRQRLLAALSLSALFWSPGALADPASALDGVQLPANAPERAELDNLVRTALAAGLPTVILTDKIREGAAKRVPPSRLLPVVRALTNRLTEAASLARAAYGDLPPPRQLPLLRALIDARTGGLEPRDLQALLVATKSHAIAASALSAVTDLLARGFPKDASLRAVIALERTRPVELERLAAEVDRARARGSSALEALELGSSGALRGPGNNNGKNGNAATDSGADNTPGNNGTEVHGPDRETVGSRGKGLAKGKGNKP